MLVLDQITATISNTTKQLPEAPLNTKSMFCPGSYVQVYGTCGYYATEHELGSACRTKNGDLQWFENDLQADKLIVEVVKGDHNAIKALIEAETTHYDVKLTWVE